MRKEIPVLFICLILACSLASAIAAHEIHDPRELKVPTPYSEWAPMYRTYEAQIHGKHLIREEVVIREYESWCRHMNFEPDYLN